MVFPTFFNLSLNLAIRSFTCYLIIMRLGFHCIKINILIDPKLQCGQKGQTYIKLVDSVWQTAGAQQTLSNVTAAVVETPGVTIRWVLCLSSVSFRGHLEAQRQRSGGKRQTSGLSIQRICKKNKGDGCQGALGSCRSMAAAPAVLRANCSLQSIDPATARCNLLFKTVLFEK